MRDSRHPPADFMSFMISSVFAPVAILCFACMRDSWGDLDDEIALDPRVAGEDVAAFGLLPPVRKERDWPLSTVPVFTTSLHLPQLPLPPQDEST